MSERRPVRGRWLRALRTLGDLRVAVTLLFALSLATPCAPLVYHAHPGGEHAHLHIDGGLAGLFGLGEAAAHRPSQATAPDHRPAYARDSGALGGHVHQQDRYHAAAVATAAFVAVSAPLAPLIPILGRRAATRAVSTASARAPPLSLVG